MARMQVARSRPIEAPYAWQGADLQHRTDWIRPFTPSELKEIDAAVQGVKRRGLDWVDVTSADFPLPVFSAELARIAQEL